MLYDEVIEVRERVVLVQEKCEIQLPNDSFLVTASTGEKVSRSRIDTKELPGILLLCEAHWPNG